MAQCRVAYEDWDRCPGYSQGCLCGCSLDRGNRPAHRGRRMRGVRRMLFFSGRSSLSSAQKATARIIDGRRVAAASCLARRAGAPKKFGGRGRPSITKTERPRSADLLQMPRGLMRKLRQRGRGYGGPEGSRGIDPSLQPPPLRTNCWGLPLGTGQCPAMDSSYIPTLAPSGLRADVEPRISRGNSPSAYSTRFDPAAARRRSRPAVPD
jgi:hypothetical protein